MDMSEIGEFGFIDRLRAWTLPASVPVGIGDDAAVVRPRTGVSLAATCDALVEDVHFRWSWSSPADIGFKAVSVNVSDLAAMGAEPRWLLLALAVPSTIEERVLKGLYEGLTDGCRTYGAELVGGDTVRAPVTMIAVTLLGELEGEPAVRSGARVGDVLAVTGPLGRAATGLNLLLSQDPTKGPPSESLACIDAHRRPEARLREGAALRRAGVHAAIDISDGLASDVRRLAEASAVGVEVDALPIAPEAARVAEARGWDAQTIALAGGEDYELLVALPEAMLDEAGCELIAIGRVVEDGVWIVRDGRREPLPAAGYDHFARGGRPESW